MCQKNGGRFGLIFSSLLLMLCAFILIGVGSILVIGKDVYKEALTYFKETLEAAATDIGATNLDTTELDIAFITRPIGVAFLVFGIIFLVVSSLGLIAGCCRFYIYVMVYVGILGFAFFAQIVVLICCYVDRQPFDTTVKSSLKDSFLDWTGIDGEDSTSLGWNAIMAVYDCCGVDDYTDATASTKWTRTINGAAEANLETPLICCHDPATDAPGCAKSTMNAYQTQTFYNRGCYTRIWAEILSYSAAITCFMGLFVITQFLCLFFAVWIICSRKSKKESKVGDYPRY